MRVLITGVSGFAGSHLVEYLQAHQPGVQISGLIRVRSRMENIEHLADSIELVECDLLDFPSVHSALEKIRPDRIFHLAAQSFVPTSWNSPVATMHTNIDSTVNLLEAMRQLGLNDCRMQIACSSEEYGMVLPEETPIRETNPLRPLSPYGVSKVAQDMLGYQYHASYGLFTVRTRGFNHEGPRRGEVFVTSAFAKQVAAVELGLQLPVIKVGNLTAKRDFTDVRDMVRGYWLALEKGVPGEVYNLASGQCITMQELLDRQLAMSTAKVTVETDPARMRPSDVEILLGDFSKFHAATGWKPEIPLEKTLTDTLAYWRERLSSEHKK